VKKSRFANGQVVKLENACAGWQEGTHLTVIDNMKRKYRKEYCVTVKDNNNKIRKIPTKYLSAV